MLVQMAEDCVVLCCSVSLPDDSTNTFVRALKDNVRPGICMVVCILPSNRKDRYDAIKTYCCVENPGTDAVCVDV